jgi:membrane protease YdiL (CAAX protease family)
MTALVAGRAGLRDLVSRLLTWRTGAGWYAVALLTAPLLQLGVLLALSLFSPGFLPAIVTASDKTSLLIMGVAVGLVGGLAEELGWTGFAIPRLRRQYSILATGSIVGVLWAVWHFLQMWWVGRTSAETVPPAIFLPHYFLSAIAMLTAYRVLMVWVYDRTQSLLVAMLMHASYIFTTLFVFAPPITGEPFLVYSWAFVVVLWAVVAALTVRATMAPHAGEQHPQPA